MSVQSLRKGKPLSWLGAPRVRLAFLLVVLVGVLTFWVVGQLHYTYQGSSASQTLSFVDRGVRYDGYLLNLKTHTILLEATYPDQRLGLTLRDAARVAPSFEFATNGGIFDAPNVPLGWTVRRGQELRPLNVSQGTGNFFLEPNGVFFLTHDNRPGVVETRKLTHTSEDVRLATQSGPLLVERGRLHPKFRRESTHRRVRSGIGVRSDGVVVLLVSQDPVTFWEFATLFRDGFRCPDALYLDGTISGVVSPGSEPSSNAGFASLLIVLPSAL